MSKNIKASIVTENEQAHYEAYNFPEDTIVRYIFGHLVTEESFELEQKIGGSVYFVQRIAELKFFIKSNSIKTYEEYNQFMESYQRKFMDSYVASVSVVENEINFNKNKFMSLIHKDGKEESQNRVKRQKKSKFTRRSSINNVLKQNKGKSPSFGLLLGNKAANNLLKNKNINK